MTPPDRMPLSYIPSPSINGFHLGPLFVHFYGLMYVIAITLAVLIAQAVGRIGNYFNQELYGRHTTMPWGLRISGHPGAYHPTFLYELVFNLALAALLVWLGHHTAIKPPGLFALYVTGYSAFCIYEESLRIDYSQHFGGLRLNTFVASALA